MTDTAPKPFAFVLMPFSDDFDDVYKLGIKPACEQAGAYGERVDEQIFEESILQRIYNQIAKADIVVADMTGRNPNVFYETGYAHALGKHVILLTRRADDIPFDLKHYPHIVYEGRICDLIPELEKRIRWAIQHPAEDAVLASHQLAFYIEGVALADAPVIDYAVSGPLFALHLVVDAHNPADRFVEVFNFQVAFVTDGMFTNSYESDSGEGLMTFKTPEGGIIHVLPNSMSLLPGAWDKFSAQFHTRDKLIPMVTEMRFALRVFSDREPRDYPFVLRVVQQELSTQLK